MAALINDGSLPYASKSLSINSVAYIAETIKLDNPSKVIERRNELGEPSGQVLVQDFSTGSATLQLATAATVLPPLGATFTKDLTVAGSNQTYIVARVSPAYAQEDATKVDIEFRLKIN